MNCIYLVIFENCFAGRQCDYAAPSFYLFIFLALHINIEEFRGEKS